MFFVVGFVFSFLPLIFILPVLLPNLYTLSVLCCASSAALYSFLYIYLVFPVAYKKKKKKQKRKRLVSLTVMTAFFRRVIILAGLF